MVFTANNAGQIENLKFVLVISKGSSRTTPPAIGGDRGCRHYTRYAEAKEFGRTETAVLGDVAVL